jgi:hypothetical protein
LNRPEFDEFRSVNAGQGGDVVRQRTDKDLLKENWWLFIGPIMFILLGILVITLTYIEKPIEYTSLQTKAVTVEKFKDHYGAYGSSYDYIRTQDGEKYIISGEYQRKQVEELLTEGTSITIKWYRNKPFWTLLAEEIYVDGISVVSYDGNAPANRTVLLSVGICAILLGLGCFCFVRFILPTNNRKTRRKIKGNRKYRKAKKRK